MKFLTVFFLFSFSLTAIADEPQWLKNRYHIPSDNEVLLDLNHTTSQVEALNPYHIDVLVWNIYKGAKVDWEQDYKKFISQKDILVLQEGFMTEKMTRVFSESDYQYLFVTSYQDRKYGLRPTGVVTASKVQPDETIWQRSYYREPVVKTPKMTLFTKYSLKGSDQKLLVGNIHGVNFVRAHKLRHMLDQAAKVMKMHKGPAIFAGDFNTWTKTKLNNMNAVMKKLGYKAVKFKNDTRKSFMGKILDHIWVKNLKVLKSEVPKSNGSDHAPMTVLLSI